MPPVKRNRGWIWYFVILVVLTLAATITVTWYNLQQQLRPEQLEAARNLWKEKANLPVIGATTVGLLGSPLGQGPFLAAFALTTGRTEKGLGDYQLVYTVKKNEETNVDRYVVTVRGGKVIDAQFNGIAEPKDRLHHYGMDRLFDFIEQFQELDAKKGRPRVFVRAIFEPETGAVLWYVRRVMGSRERVEITVEKFER